MTYTFLGRSCFTSTLVPRTMYAYMHLEVTRDIAASRRETCFSVRDGSYDLSSKYGSIGRMMLVPRILVRVSFIIRRAEILLSDGYQSCLLVCSPRDTNHGWLGHPLPVSVLCLLFGESAGEQLVEHSRISFEHPIFHLSAHICLTHKLVSCHKADVHCHCLSHGLL